MRGSRRNRHVAGAAAVLLAALALSVAPAAAALAADGGIAGTVVNGTTAQGVGNEPVTIVYFDDQGKIGSAKVMTAGDGTFAATPPALATGFQATTTYQGTEFRSQGTQLIPGKTATVKLQVFDGTTDTKDVALSQWVVWVDQDPTTGAYAVQQDFGIGNAGDKAYIGTDGVVMSVPLADGAKNLQFLGTFLEQRGKIADGTYVSGAAIVPGDTTATLRYETNAISTLPLTVPFSVRDFQLYVPVGLQAQAPGIRPVGTITDQTADGSTVTYQQYAIDVLQPGTDVAVTLAPASGSADGSGASAWLLYVVAGIALIAVAVFLILWLRNRKTAAPSKERPRKTVAAPKTAARTARAQTANVATRPANGHANRPPARSAAVDTAQDDEMQLLVDEIAALDLSYEQGLLDERTYRRLRVAAKDRLLLAQEATEGRGVRR